MGGSKLIHIEMQGKPWRSWQLQVTRGIMQHLWDTATNLDSRVFWLDQMDLRHPPAENPSFGRDCLRGAVIVNEKHWR